MKPEEADMRAFEEGFDDFAALLLAQGADPYSTLVIARNRCVRCRQYFVEEAPTE